MKSRENSFKFQFTPGKQIEHRLYFCEVRAEFECILSNFHADFTLIGIRQDSPLVAMDEVRWVSCNMDDR